MSSNGFTSQHASGRTPLSSVVDAMLMGAMMGAFLGMCFTCIRTDLHLQTTVHVPRVLVFYVRKGSLVSPELLVENLGYDSIGEPEVTD